MQSWWARLSTGASREAPVDNECLGKCRQVGDSGEPPSRPSFVWGKKKQRGRNDSYYGDGTQPPTLCANRHASVSIRPHQSASARICPHQSASVLICPHPSASVRISPHQSSSARIRPHQSASVRISPHQSASVRIRPHPSASVRISPGKSRQV